MIIEAMACALFFLIVFALTSWILIKRRASSNSLPPGKLGFPFLGETLAFFQQCKNGTLHKFFHDRMTRFSKEAFKTSLFGQNVVVLCGAKGNKFLFSTDSRKVTPWWPYSIRKIFPPLESTIDHSLKFRSFLNTFIKADHLQKYIGEMDETAKSHVKEFWEGRNEVTVYPLVKDFAFMLACRLFMGIEDRKEIEKFKQYFDDIAAGVYSMPIDLPGTTLNRAIKASQLAKNKIAKLMLERKKDAVDQNGSPSSIITHIMMSVDQDGQPVDERIVSNYIIGLLVGGHHTSSGVLTSIIMYLADYPEDYERVLKEQTRVASEKPEGELLSWQDMGKMRYTWNVACEAMRLVSPLPGVFRESSNYTEFAGFTIPYSWKMHASIVATHMDPEYFPKPEVFDPTRFEGTGPSPYTYIPFGGGVRGCPGKEFARLQILALIHNLVRKFKWKRVIPEEKIVQTPLPRPAYNLPVRLYPHN